MPIKVTMYECSHCQRRKYSHESSAKQHEKKCYWNPTNKACASCGNQDNDKMVCLVGGWDLSKRTELRRDCPLWTMMNEEEF